MLFEMNIEIEYSLNGKIEYEITKTNFLVDNVFYSDRINYKIFVIKDEENLFFKLITEITNGKFKIISSKEKNWNLIEVNKMKWIYVHFIFKLKIINNLRYKQKMLINHKK